MGNLAKEALAFCRAVSAMACMLLAAADCGVPKWSGQAIQAVAPYGKTGSWAYEKSLGGLGVAITLSNYPTNQLTTPLNRLTKKANVSICVFLGELDVA